MEEKKNRVRLLQIMLKSGLNRGDVAKMTDRSNSVVRQWLAPDGARDIPIEVLRLLEYKIGEER